MKGVAYFLLTSALLAAVSVAILKMKTRRPEGYEPPIGCEQGQYELEGWEVETVAYGMITVALLAALAILGNKISIKLMPSLSSIESGVNDPIDIRKLEVKMRKLESALDIEQQKTADSIKNTREIERNMHRVQDLVDTYKKQAQEAEEIEKSELSEFRKAINPALLVGLEAPPVQTKHGKVWYVILARKMSWEEGKKFCDDNGLKMARIYNSQENKAIFALKLRLLRKFGDHNIYVGGSIPTGVTTSGWSTRGQLKNMFTWWNGDKVGDIGWAIGEPNNCGNERFIAMKYNCCACASWNDTVGGHLAYIACEYRIGFDG